MRRTRDAVGGISRRQLLSIAAAGGVVALAGCLDGGEDVPDPVSLDARQMCDNCDMQIEVHPGPVGQAYYLDDPPVDLPERDNGAAYFCSTRCTYTYVLERADETQPSGIYATDYSAVEYTIYEDGGVTVISAHLEAETFEDGEELVYVVDSDVEGAMGGSLIGFSDGDDAQEFADEHGGMLIDHGDVTLEVIASL